MRKKVHMDKKTIELVASKISDMTIPYLNEYPNKIIGIYLSPYRIGKKENIEIVIVKDTEEKLPILKPKCTVSNIRIYLNICDISNYTLQDSWYVDYKYIKDLKNGRIIYDPKNELLNKKSNLPKRKQVTFFNNSSELPKGVAREVKIKLKN